jgi:hypothetical protein
VSRRLLALLLLAGLLLAGCGLPLPSGVQAPGDVRPEDIRGNGLQVLPPGPSAAYEPDDVVRQFIEAQVNGERRHAFAREFLAPEIRDDWDDTAGAFVYDEPQLEIQDPVPGDQPGTVRVRVDGAYTARISADGSYVARSGALSDTYTLREDPAEGWQLTQVPPGLRLDPQGFALTFAARSVYYLARGTGPDGHLAADLAFLPSAEDPAAALVRRLLAGPSETLRGAVDTAVPPGAVLRSVTSDPAGLVTVDLGPALAGVSLKDRERLSAQLVWTLRGAGSAFVDLRLVADGLPVDVPGVETGEPQPRDAWADYDPDGLDDRGTAYYLDGRTVRTLDGQALPATTTPGRDVPADLAAVSPRTNQLAVLTDVGDTWEVRAAALSEQLPERPQLVAKGLRSLSWGSGARGLWLLQDDGGPRVLLLDNGAPRPVPVDVPASVGRLVGLRVSRDGTRVALIAGDDAASRRGYVGTVEQNGDDLRITKVRVLAADVTEVADIAWENGTTLVVLGRFADFEEPLPLRLSVDGSTAVDLVRLAGLGRRTPLSLAAADGRPLLLAATEPDGRRAVLRDQGGGLVRLFDGGLPFYPG